MRIGRGIRAEVSVRPHRFAGIEFAIELPDEEAAAAIADIGEGENPR